jgi:hypothetical protein
MPNNKPGSSIYIERANLRRGDMLSRSISLERAIDQYIADYFVERSDKRNLELMALILSAPERMGFEGKRQVALWIAQNNDQGLIKDYPKMFGEIQKLIRFRNKMAHSILAFEGFHKKNENQITTLTIYKNKVEQFDLSEKECEKWGDIASKYTAVFLYTSGYQGDPI